ncbi:MAG: hypothetical protein KDK91_28575 [Gammaproteobacteria bacterium]|nr:hypothetical protein [Gammaproteobacteria bacterium]
MTQLLIIALLVGLFAAYAWAKRQSPEVQRVLFARLAMVAGAVLFLILLVRGINPLLAFVAGLLPAAHGALRLLGNLKHIKRMAEEIRDGSGGSGDARKEREASRSLCMFTLSDGTLDGEVLRGVHAGRRLSEMSGPELHALLADWTASDPRSASLLAEFLSSRRTQARGDARGKPDQTEVEEALKLLGLGRDASRDEVLRAHRRIMQRVHPDMGGSDYLAFKINHAREVLLKWLPESGTAAS